MGLAQEGAEMIKFILSQLEILLQKLPEDTVKKVLDKLFDIIEEQLNKDGLTAWEKVAHEGVQYLRRALKITEEEGSPYAD